MRIVVAGSSGFLGGHLLAALHTDGHDVTRLVRRPPTSPDEVRWDPGRGELDPGVLADTDAVINLTGVNIGARRWTDEFKAELRASRVEPTAALARTAAALPEPHRPKALFNASAVGYYGDTDDRTVTEQSPSGEGFFAALCRDWEAATEPAEEAGIRVVRLRTGLPLAANGGLLKPLLLQFRLFAGGRIGTGRQFMPWISMADWVGAIRFLLYRVDISGPVNLCGPNPVRNAEFARALGAVLHRPAILPVPWLAMRAVLGELADEAVASVRVLPGVLTQTGYEFQHSDVRAALRAALR